MKKALLYKKLKNNLVQCTACSWYCKITAGNAGVCATRYNKDGELYSLVYGKAIGLHLDPVEKKPLYHFLPGKTLLSFGTVGCNFGCLFCQNYDISQINKEQITCLAGQPAGRHGRHAKNKQQNNIEKMLVSLIDSFSTAITPEEIVKMAIKEGAAGIAYTYNEPAIFAEYAFETAKIAKAKGLVNVYVSNGFESKETFNLLKNYLDAINIDLKSFREDFYQKICKAKIEPVKENIKRFFQAGIETEVTTLIIPGHNDSAEELTNIAKFLAGISTDIPWHISAFYPCFKMNDVSPTPHQTLLNAYEIGKKAGLKYIYVGNIMDEVHSSTYCPKCKQLLISRINYFTRIVGLDSNHGKCNKCSEKIYGRWSKYQTSILTGI